MEKNQQDKDTQHKQPKTQLWETKNKQTEAEKNFTSSEFELSTFGL